MDAFISCSLALCLALLALGEAEPPCLGCLSPEKDKG